ncbi:MAG TPA: hypothetical protein VHL78_03735 [Actinomycetota bacterium]|nr:hypothetical protein [Actinomycetota bacterium]
MENTRSSSRKLYLGLALAATLALVAVPATAAHIACRVSDTTPSPGETIGVAGDGFQPGSTVEIFYDDPTHQTLIGTATVNQRERFSANVTIPADAELGTAQIIVRGLDAHSGNPTSCSVTIRVVPSDG